MVASLLCHERRTARRFTAQRASDTICVALAPTRGQTLANLEADPFWVLIEEGGGHAKHF